MSTQPEAAPLWMREVAKTRTDGLCWYCGIVLDNIHVDHIQPRSRGGKHELANLVPTCPPCNLSKADMTIDQWRAKLFANHAFSFEANGLDHNPIPTPEDCGWFVTELDQAVKALLTKLRCKHRTSQTAILEMAIRALAKQEGVT